MLKFLFSRIPERISQPKILLVDDDRDIRTITNLVLLTHNLGEVVEASSGQEGIDAARAERPDVILLDLQMPDMNGETVLQLLRTDPWTRDIPVVLFTASTRDQKRLRKLDVNNIVLKPFHPEHLCNVIRGILESQKQHASSLTPKVPVENVAAAPIAIAQA